MSTNFGLKLEKSCR